MRLAGAPAAAGAPAPQPAAPQTSGAGIRRERRHHPGPRGNRRGGRPHDAAGGFVQCDADQRDSVRLLDGAEHHAQGRCQRRDRRGPRRGARRREDRAAEREPCAHRHGFRAAAAPALHLGVDCDALDERTRLDDEQARVRRDARARPAGAAILRRRHHRCTCDACGEPGLHQVGPASPRRHRLPAGSGPSQHRADRSDQAIRPRRDHRGSDAEHRDRAQPFGPRARGRAHASGSAGASSRAAAAINADADQIGGDHRRQREFLGLLDPAEFLGADRRASAARSPASRRRRIRARR